MQRTRWLALAAAATCALCAGSVAAQPLRPVAPDGRLGVFEEPLVAIGSASPAEERELREAVSTYRASGDPVKVSSLERFIHKHPNTPWKVALLTNIGLAYEHGGYFSKALEAFRRAWHAAPDSGTPEQRALHERALGELLWLDTRVGRAEELRSLFAQLGSRELLGPASEKLAAAREGLWDLQHNPGDAYRCGAVALADVLPLETSAPKLDRLSQARSPRGGFNLAQLARLAEAGGVPSRVVFRRAGEAIPVPSVVHWKVGHFGAIVGAANGRFHIKDPALQRDLWMSAAAVAAESSGYFLVPKSTAALALREVPRKEAERMVGGGDTNGSDPTATSIDDATVSGCGSCSSRGVAQYSVHGMLVSLNIHDTPIGYRPPKGPAVHIIITYSQREAYQPANFTFFNLGRKWTLNWLGYVQDDPRAPGYQTMVYLRGGGARFDSGYSTSTGAFAREERTGAQLVRVSATRYERRMPDGSKEVYGQSDGSAYYPRRIFLTQVVDSAGNAVSLTYDAQMRLTTLTDALGQQTTFQYEDAERPLLVTGVTDPFGRHAAIAYDPSGRLTSLTDVIGMQSHFEYQGNGTFIDALTTPYGTTHFASGQAGVERWLEITDPLGHKERVEYNHGATGIPVTERLVPSGIRTFNAELNGRNTFFWDKDAMQNAPGDYTQARIFHWLHLASDTSLAAGVLESTKEPLEDRVWFDYPGQDRAGATGSMDRPSAVARVLDDGSTQLTRLRYNALQRVTQFIDPVGRETDYEYAANQMDLVKVTRKTATGDDVLARYTYNDQHLPLTVTDAAGQVTHDGYNAAGQLTQITDALGSSTRFNYDANGYLLSVIDANGKTAERFTYDAFGRVATTTDSEGLTKAYAYDALDRLTRITFPDGTHRDFGWDKLDRVSMTDREGRTTTFTYDALGNMVAKTDALGHSETFGYFLNGALRSITDENGNTTTYVRDLQGRITAKLRADGKGDTYAYEPRSGRLHSVTDALGQVRQYGYTRADERASITYLRALNPTPAVTFKYDSYYPRLVSMTDGAGTTSYQYIPAGSFGAGQLAQVQGADSHDVVQYAYDALGRTTTESVDGAAETFQYDSLGRPIGDVNPLGNFTISYLGETSQPTLRTAANVPYQVTYQYEDNLHDRRLRAILNETTVNGVTRPLANFSFTTSPEGLILSRTEDDGDTSAAPFGKANDPHPVTRQYTYDADRRLTASNGGKTERYTYDPAHNRLGSIRGAGTNTFAANPLNEWVSTGATPYLYDANGNVLDDGKRSYAWDAENRLVAMRDKATGHLSQFTYDGRSHRVRDTETEVGSAPEETRLLWCGERLCEERDAADAVRVRFYSEGEREHAKAAYYARDQVGSVVASVDSTGTVLGRTEYDSFGDVTGSSGTPTQLGYAGMLHHVETGLELATYRPYAPWLGRFLGPEPMLADPRYPTSMARSGLPVLKYGYALSNPLSNLDPDGLAVVLKDQLAIDYFNRFATKDPVAAEMLIASRVVFTFEVDTETERTLNGNHVQGYTYPSNTVVLYQKNIDKMASSGSTHDGDFVFAHEVGELLAQNAMWHGAVKTAGGCGERQVDVYASTVTGQSITKLDRNYWAGSYPECGAP